MNRRPVPRPSLAGLAFLLAIGLLLTFAVPALADYLGPDRTVSVWQWERLQCSYQAVYDPAGPGWYGCTVQLYASPDSGCPSTSSVAGYFTRDACGWTEPWCQTRSCNIGVSSSTVGCTEGEPGCTAVERFTTLPEATINGSVSCGVPGYGGWCLSTAALSLSGSEPLSGYSILALEGTRDGETFACPSDNCAVPLLEGTSDFTYWAVSSWGDTSRMGMANGRVDTQPPGISGSISGTAGDNGWYVSDVVFSASASDGSPGSGVTSFQISLDGGAWAAYTAPLTLSEGSHSVDLRAGDAAGHESTQSQAIQVDSQPPTLALSAADSFCPGCGDTLEITLDVEDSLSGVVAWELRVDGSVIASGTAPTGQTLTWNGSGLLGGAYALLLSAQDAAGNAQETSQPVMLLVPTLPPASSTPVQAVTTRNAWTPRATSLPTGAPTATPQPTRTPSISVFGGPPVAPVGPGASPAAGLPSDDMEASTPTAVGPSSGVLLGAGAAALTGAAASIALGALRKRREEEGRLRAEIEEAKRARLRAAAAATAAAWVAQRQAEEWLVPSISDEGRPGRPRPADRGSRGASGDPAAPPDPTVHGGVARGGDRGEVGGAGAGARGA